MADERALLMWQKIKPSPEVTDVAEALRCEVYDPLWILGRQWQMGEFKAEDAGTAAFASVDFRSFTPDQLLGKNKTQPAPLPADTPLNPLIESVPMLFTMQIRLEASRKWMKMLTAAGKKAAWNRFIATAALQFKLPAQEYDAENEDLISSAAENFSCWIATVSNGRMIDGLLLYEAMKTKKASAIVGLNDTKVDDIGNEWLKWIERLTGISTSNQYSSWDASRLEYSASLTIPTNNGKVHLQTPEYFGTALNGYSWEEKPALSNPATESSPGISNRQIYIPNPVSFPGMPAARWWAFEDGTIDFSNMQADNTNFGMLLLAEFGLIYSNDWLLVPLSVASGSLTKIQSLDITDVFGVQTTLSPMQQDQHWEMFGSNSGVSSGLRGCLFLPSHALHVNEAEKNEEVILFRDEMGNLVWAVEKTIQDRTGQKLDAGDAAVVLEKFLADLDTAPPPAVPEDPNSGYRYQIANTVPPNWIPFIPVRPQATSAEIVFRRSALPRFSNGHGNSRIRPRTQILKNQEAGQKRYDITEEEIPLSGINVSQVIRRTRGTDGSVITWQARNKIVGRANISGGLQFDQMVNFGS